MIQIKNFHQAELYLTSLVHQGKRQIFQGIKGLEKMRYFLSLLNSPQNDLKIIHIAGTAGKGSTCYLISRLLVNHGYKVGLHLSPHLTDVRERFQINNKIISKKNFIFYLNKLIPIVETVKSSRYGDLSYFEVLVALAFYIFKEKKVDYAVIETGLGGLYDATNVVDRNDKVSVITKVGYDHMEILGNSIKEITYQKAMIINKKSQALVINQQKDVIDVVKRVAKDKNSQLIIVNSENINVSLLGDYQKENASLALKTLEFLSFRDKFKIKKITINKVFNSSNFIGRFDIRKVKEKTVILDGAHNQLKMEAFCRALKERYKDRKLHFLIAFKKGKDFQTMLKYITPLASEITITSFFVDNQDLVHLSEEPEKISKTLKNTSNSNIKIIKQLNKAFDYVLKSKEEIIVVTGSLYLLGEIYKILSL